MPPPKSILLPCVSMEWGHGDTLFSRRWVGHGFCMWHPLKQIIYMWLSSLKAFFLLLYFFRNHIQLLLTRILPVVLLSPLVIYNPWLTRYCCNFRVVGPLISLFKPLSHITIYWVISNNVSSNLHWLYFSQTINH